MKELSRNQLKQIRGGDGSDDSAMDALLHVQPDIMLAVGAIYWFHIANVITVVNIHTMREVLVQVHAR